MSLNNSSLENSTSSAKQAKTNSNLKSTIVHKPFATGTINILNPHKNKSHQPKNFATPPEKIFLDAQLEESELSAKPAAESSAPKQNWFDRLITPWSVSAIAIIFLTNLVSGAIIWRNYRLENVSPAAKAIATLGNKNIAEKEFIPLNLSTLSMIEPTEITASETSVIEPISPALAPIDSTVISSINPPYYYILSEYTGDRSLSLARQKVKHVSLVNLTQGVFIYLGAFTTKEQAEEFISQIAEREFPARVYPFN